ncbi:MAG: hypothetical protein E7028_07365 [Planctomycetaceae bacterium]|nr:hypothetical protein [Planctomycetaceae bacterium]MBQ2821987.1 hypothetical protein [Thermoguttaceae bacterium]
MEDYSLPAGSSCECCVTHRKFYPGEEYVSVLFEGGGNCVRKDYSLEAWQSHAPEKYLAMWKTRAPSQTEPRKSRTAINDLLLAMFDQLRESGETPDKLYVLSLLLVRRRIMRLEEQFDENAARYLRLYSQFRDEYYQIPAAYPTPKRQEEIQTELMDVLIGNEPQPPQKLISEEEAKSIQIWDPDEIELPDLNDLSSDI